MQLGEQEALDRFLAEPSEESFSDLFRAIAPRIFAYFRARGCEQSLADDLTQDVMLTVFRQVDTLRDRQMFRSWLYRVAKNVLLQSVRRKGRQVETVNMDTAALIGDRKVDPLLRSQFQEWMEFLENDERQIMMLRYFEELQYHEIAAALGLPLGTVQWKIFHCKKKLAAYFKMSKR